MSRPTNRTALRDEENRPAPPSQAHSASAVIGPDAVDVVHQRPGAVQVPGGRQQPAAQRSE